VPSGLRPTARRTAGKKLDTEIVCGESLPERPEPEPPASKTTSRARRSLTLAEVASEMIGSPIVTHKTATSGRASRIGSARERVRARERAEGSRRGRST
jgi:hypothetical protein